MKGYKAFDEDWKCRGLQYKIGEVTKHDDKLEMCNKGLHFCENPLDVLRYYSPTDSKFAEIEADKVSNEKKTEDTKRVCGSIKINAELKLSAIIKAGVDWVVSKYKATSGDSSPAATSGDYSHAATSGDSSLAATSGENSIAASIGFNSTAKAAKGSWIVLAEYDQNYKVICVKTVKVDGRKIKAGKYYKLVNKKFVEAKA